METTLLEIMTQEEKQLLLVDLCARVPYEPKVKVLHVWNEEKEIEEDVIDTIHCVFPEGYINTGTIDGDIPFDDIILYLRPMSSMTEEERRYLLEELGFDEDLENGELNDFGSYVYHSVNVLPLFDWLNAHHFDYRGLIPMGLALEAPKDMYNIWLKKESLYTHNILMLLKCISMMNLMHIG